MEPYYDDGKGIVIWCADCRDVLPTLDAGSVDLVLTDPPYKIKNMNGGGFASASRFYRGGALDGMTDFVLAEYSSLLALFRQVVAFHSRDQIVEWAAFCLRLGHYDLHVWHKVNAIPFTHNTWKSDIEYIALGWSEKSHAPVSQEVKSKVWISGIETGDHHPTQKPLGLMKKYITVLAPQSVLDPFMGSGTTLVAAKALGRRAIGIEIEERYCEIAANRLQQDVLPLAVDPPPVVTVEQMEVLL